MEFTHHGRRTGVDVHDWRSGVHLLGISTRGGSDHLSFRSSQNQTNGDQSRNRKDQSRPEDEFCRCDSESDL